MTEKGFAATHAAPIAPLIRPPCWIYLAGCGGCGGGVGGRRGVGAAPAAKLQAGKVCRVIGWLVRGWLPVMGGAVPLAA